MTVGAAAIPRFKQADIAIGNTPRTKEGNENLFQSTLAKSRTGFYCVAGSGRGSRITHNPGGLSVALTADAFQSTIDWRKDARCRDTDPGLFFPVGTTGMAIEQIDIAKAVCLECNAREACLEFALSTNQDTGVWGGTSEEERRVIRRRRRQERSMTNAAG